MCEDKKFYMIFVLRRRQLSCFGQFKEVHQKGKFRKGDTLNSQSYLESQTMKKG